MARSTGGFIPFFAEKTTSGEMANPYITLAFFGKHELYGILYSETNNRHVPEILQLVKNTIPGVLSRSIDKRPDYNRYPQLMTEITELPISVPLIGKRTLCLSSHSIRPPCQAPKKACLESLWEKRESESPRFLLRSAATREFKDKARKLLNDCETARQKNTSNIPLVVKFLLKEAELLLTLDMYQTACDRLTECLQLDPQNIDALATRALTLAYLDNPEEAIFDIKRAICVDPSHLKTLLNCVIIHVDCLQDYANAVEILKIAAHYHPTNQRVIGYSHLLRVKLPKSDVPLPKAAADFLFLSGRTALTNKQPALALERLSRALFANPEHMPSLLARGNIYKDQGNLEEAKRDFQVCLSLAPYNSSALFGLACCEYINRNYIAALAHLNRILESDPPNINVLFLRGEVNRKISRCEDALQDLTCVINFFHSLHECNDRMLMSGNNKRGYARVLSIRASVKYELIANSNPSEEQLQDILEDFNISLQYCNEPSVYIRVAGIFMSLRDYEKAQFYVNESLKRHPNDFGSLVTAGRICRAQKMFLKAEEMLLRAIEQKKDIVAYMHLVGVYIDMKSYHTALATIDRISSVHTDAELSSARQAIMDLLARDQTQQSQIASTFVSASNK